jgi:DNA polymerase-3 subunit epsilon
MPPPFPGRRWRQARRFRAARDRCREPVLDAWLEAAARLSPGTLAETGIVAADLELTGLDPATAEIVSLGWTEIVGGRIHMAANRYFVLQPEGSVGASATIHELRDQDLAEGVSTSTALEALFKAARGKLLLFHHAGLDAPCLQRACEGWAGCRPPLPVVDTLRIEAERRSRRGQVVEDGARGLRATRRPNGVPEHQVHNALGDAVATAELFLAMTSRAVGRTPPDLESWVRVF